MKAKKMKKILIFIFLFILFSVSCKKPESKKTKKKAIIIYYYEDDLNCLKQNKSVKIIKRDFKSIICGNNKYDALIVINNK